MNEFSLSGSYFLIVHWLDELCRRVWSYFSVAVARPSLMAYSCRQLRSHWSGCGCRSVSSRSAAVDTATTGGQIPKLPRDK